jgi:hypothetical protein
MRKLSIEGSLELSEFNLPVLLQQHTALVCILLATESLFCFTYIPAYVRNKYSTTSLPLLTPMFM